MSYERITDGGGVTPGIDDVLAVGQDFTQNGILSLQDFDFVIQDGFGGIKVDGTNDEIVLGDYLNTDSGTKLKVIPATSTAYLDNTAHNINVGINNNHPSKTLEIGDQANNGATLKLSISAADDNNFSIRELESDGDNYPFQVNANSKNILFDQGLLGYKVGIGTASPAATLDVVGDAKISGTINGVKRYVALLTQSGTDLTPTELENSIGPISAVYDSPSYYFITSSGLFTANKTVVIIGGTISTDDPGNPTYLNYKWVDSSTLQLISAAYGDLWDSSITILVYP